MEFEYDERDLEGLARIVVLAGPTGVGKTDLSLRLAEALGGEIVGADSLQVYRYLDIGTAKATAAERARVAHHLIDVRDPDEEFNAADYKRLAGEAIADIRARGRVPIVVGGTGLYIRLLVHGLFDAPEPDPALREKYRRLIEARGAAYMYGWLEEVDPELAARVNPNDMIRVTRGLEIFEQTGRRLSELQHEHRFAKPSYHALKIALVRPRADLYERINMRVDRMIEAGLVEEYRGLVARGFDPALKPLQSLGYRQIGQHLYEGVALEEAVHDVKRETRRYAKQQISWLRREPGVHWALAPILRDGKIPPEVLADVRAFVEGGRPEMTWAQADPYAR